MNEKLQKLGFAEQETAHPKIKAKKTELRIHGGYNYSATFIMSKEDVKAVNADWSDVDFGVNDKLEIAVCEGNTRRLSDSSSGRKKIRMDNLFNAFAIVIYKKFKDKIKTSDKDWNLEIYYNLISFEDGIAIFSPYECLETDRTGSYPTYNRFKINKEWWS